MDEPINPISPTQTLPGELKRRRWYKRWWGILVMVLGLYLVALFVILAFFGPSAEDNISLVGEEAVPDSVLYLNTADDPKWGEPGAPLKIMEFADFQCPYCRESFPVIRELFAKYPSQIYFIWRDFPDAINHPEAVKAAIAGNCAEEQGKFWPFHDKLFINQENLILSDLKRYAQEVGLNTQTFAKCLESPKYQQEVQEDYDAGVALGVVGTPTFFINGYKLSGSLPREVFSQIAEMVLSATSSQP